MPSPRLVVLDDTAQDIKYGPLWVQQTSTDPSIYMRTLTSTNGNTSFTFEFTGTRIDAIGSFEIKQVNGTQDPRWECYIDEKPIRPAVDGFVKRPWSLCSTGDLSDSKHNFTLRSISRGSPLYFDALAYQPSSDSDLSEKVIKIENNDEAIQYKGNFSALDNFANMTQETGASVSLDFIGKALTWYGYVPQDPFPHTPSTATYSIDGGPAHTFDLVGLSRRNQIFFTTPDLTPGPHSLVVTHGGNTGTTPLVLDYLLVTNATVPVMSSNTTIHASDSSSPSTPSNDSPKETSTGAIVGGTVGGVFSLAGLCFVVFFIIQRRNTSKRWSTREKIRSIETSFADTDTDEYEIPSKKPNRRAAPFNFQPTHKLSNSDASLTAPLFSSYPSDSDHTSNTEYNPEQSITTDAYVSHQNRLFLEIPDSSETDDQFYLSTPITPTGRDYEHAVAMLALEGPTGGALHTAPTSEKPRVVHRYHVETEYTVTMGPDGYTGVSLLQADPTSQSDVRWR